MIDAANTTEHREDFLELIRNRFFFFQTRFRIWFTEMHLPAKSVRPSEHTLNLCHPCRVKIVCFFFNPIDLHENIDQKRKIENLQYFWSVLVFDFYSIHRSVTAVTFLMTFYVWVTISVNNICSETRYHKVNKNVHKRTNEKKTKKK